MVQENTMTETMLPIGQQVRGRYHNARLNERRLITGIVSLHEGQRVVVREDHSWVPLDKLTKVAPIGTKMYELYIKAAHSFLEGLDLTKLDPKDTVQFLEEIANSVTKTVGGPTDEEAANQAAADALKTQIASEANPQDVQKAATDLLLQTQQESRLREGTFDNVKTMVINWADFIARASKVPNAGGWGEVLGLMTPEDYNTSVTFCDKLIALLKAAYAPESTVKKLAWLQNLHPGQVELVIKYISTLREFLACRITAQDYQNANSQQPSLSRPQLWQWIVSQKTQKLS
jgi:hypothetical protein